VGRDMEIGGASSLFSRVSTPGGMRYSGDVMVMAPHRRLRRLGDYGANYDSYGDLSARGSHNPLEIGSQISHAESGEWMMRDIATFMDDGEIQLVGSPAVREAWLAELRSRGVHVIRGVPIEERIVVSGQISKAEYVKSFFRKYVNGAERLRRDASVFAQTAAAKAKAAVPESMQGIVSRLRVKDGKLTKKLSVGREMRTYLNTPTGGRVSATVNYHVSENALSIDDVYGLTDSISGSPVSIKSVGQVLPTATKTVIDLSSVGIDIKNMAPAKRKYFISRFLNALQSGSDINIKSVLEQYGSILPDLAPF
jgi:hypothetical protein